MELYQRKDSQGNLLSPFYYFDVTLPDGKRVRRSTKEKTYNKAQKVMVATIHDAEAEAKAGPKAITIREALRGYSLNLASRGKRMVSAEVYADKLVGAGTWTGKDIFTFNGDLPISELTKEDVERFKVCRAAEGYKPSTIALELRVLRAALARIGGKARPDIKWEIEAPKGKLRWLSHDEWRRVYDELEPARPVGLRGGGTAEPRPSLVQARIAARDLFVALTLCGGRWGEVAKLTVDQVIHGDPVKLRLYGWKTGKERLVPVPPAMAEVLLRRSQEAVEAGRLYLFPRGPYAALSTKEHVTRSKAIRDALDRAGLNAPHIVERMGVATIHSLRHTFASWLRQRGMTLGEIGDLLGHASENTTTIYAHLAPDVTVDTANKVLTKIVAEALAA